ncbi:MAG: hypothetical protein Aurels2KO_27440 [Aureliella sp.]
MSVTPKFVRRSLLYFSSSHVALAAGIAAAVAVIVGALVVGDSVRRSLRGLVLDRLGSVQSLMHSRTFFNPAILDGIELKTARQAVSPAILLSESTVENRTDDRFFRASNVQVIAADPQLLDQASGTEDFLELGEDEVALNASLASELAVSIGDEITLRFSKTPGAPADNPLGRRDDAVISLPRQEVVAILPDKSFAGVTFFVGQSAPKNVFCSLSTVQDILECGSSVNAALVTDPKAPARLDESLVSSCDSLNLQLQPTIDDYGLQLSRHTRVFPDEDSEASEPVFDYFQISSDELIIDSTTADAITSKLGKRAKPSITYLANTIVKTAPTAEDLSAARSAASYEARRKARNLQRANGSAPAAERRRVVVGQAVTVRLDDEDVVAEFDQGNERDQVEVEQSREVPYSIVVGIEEDAIDLWNHAPLELSELQVPFCWVNNWLAKEIDVQPGDWIKMRYFMPETVDGRAVETDMNFMVAGIVDITEPTTPYVRRREPKYSSAPTVFNDPNLTPSVPGVTDQDSISKWDLPFPIDEELILDQDDDYWKNHRLTPKVFGPHHLFALDALFGSRFGRTTAIRIDASDVESEQSLRDALDEALLEARAVKGLAFRPVRYEQLKASSGATPFDMLFLSLSFFVIVAALVLVVLLLKLGIERRAGQLGALFAIGFTQRRVRWLLLKEYSAVAFLGGLVGVAIGIGYARLMIAGLQTWWVGAISTPFLEFSFGYLSLAIGLAVGLIASLIVMYSGLRRISRVEPLGLLRGRVDERDMSQASPSRAAITVAGFSLAGALGLMFFGLGQTGMARAGIFFGCGMLTLVAVLVAVGQVLRTGGGKVQLGGPLITLAVRAIRRNATRTTLSLSLLSVASFLIASMGVFQISPSEEGYGGFDLIGASSQPIFDNLASSTAREAAIGDAASALRGSTVIAMRMEAGEDASCNNLFQVAKPTILGVPSRLREMTDLAPEAVKFAWAAKKNEQNPWRALQRVASGDRDDPIPVILDQNTAAWSLKQGASLGAQIVVEYDTRKLHFETVGLLSNSVLQGKLMIAEANFEKQFPHISGYRYFMVRSGGRPEAVAEGFESGWSDQGLDLAYSSVQLEQLLGVQNTYISAFQTLGALGLLLGTFGLAAVQMRNIVERRKELALMQAVGYSRSRITLMLTLETTIVLGLGLLLGILAAGIALAPFVWETGPQLALLMPAASLLLVMAVGFVAAAIASRQATKLSVLAGLRSE